MPIKPRVSKAGRRYNWIPDLPDHRDKKYCSCAAGPLPSSSDLRPQCPPIVDQGSVGSCTGNSLAGAWGFLELKELAAKLSGQAEEFAATFVPASRLFIYWNERVMEGDPNQDGGAQIRDGVKTLASTGACDENLWPYNTSATFTAPSASCFSEAAGHKISQYMSLDNTNGQQLKACLAEGYPVVFGFTVYESFESAQTAETGIMTMPTPEDSPVGGHAVLCVGYDDARQMYIIRNSWGTSWGAGGYFFMPYSYMHNPDLADDAWTLRK